MLVVGLDPGGTRTGLAWIRQTHRGVERNAFRIPVMGTYPQRYIILREKLERAFSFLPERPVAVAIEEPDWRVDPGKDPKEFMKLHAIYSVIVAEVARNWNDVVLHHLRPGSWKNMETKDVTAARIGEKYRISRFESDDASDALAIADFAFKISLKTMMPDPPAGAPIVGIAQTYVQWAGARNGAAPPGHMVCEGCGETVPLRTKLDMRKSDEGRFRTQVKIPHCAACAKVLNLDERIETFEQMKRIEKHLGALPGPVQKSDVPATPKEENDPHG